MRWFWLVLGVIAILVGTVWTLQGLNILGGSAMSGHLIFTALGLIVAVIGLFLVVLSVRRRAPSV